jgi:prephenate dehydrogenase
MKYLFESTQANHIHPFHPLAGPKIKHAWQEINFHYPTKNASKNGFEGNSVFVLIFSLPESQSFSILPLKIVAEKPDEA